MKESDKKKETLRKKVFYPYRYKQYIDEQSQGKSASGDSGSTKEVGYSINDIVAMSQNQISQMVFSFDQNMKALISGEKE